MRKTKRVVIDEPGSRDYGSQYLLTEMSALKAEDWGLRVMLALGNAGVTIPDDIANLGMVGVARIGLEAVAGLKIDAARPILAEMLDCVRFIPDPKFPDINRAPLEDDIQEVKTLLTLRKEVYQLHIGFLGGGGLSPSTSDL